MSSHLRVLMHRVGKPAQQYCFPRTHFTTLQVQSITSVIQGYTQSGGVPSLGGFYFFFGWNDEGWSGRSYLFQSHPSRPYFAWKVTSMGKNYVAGKTSP
uniref:Uncharacterized protein n=1 Tax=Moschus moschiferus TaxID=68415 RepID=A0A8C6FTR3_MOSMO